MEGTVLGTLAVLQTAKSELGDKESFFDLHHFIQ